MPNSSIFPATICNRATPKGMRFDNFQGVARRVAGGPLSVTGSADRAHVQLTNWENKLDEKCQTRPTPVAYSRLNYAKFMSKHKPMP